MSLLKKIFKSRYLPAITAAKARLAQLASAGLRLRGVMHTTAAGYFGAELDGDLHADDELWLEPTGVIRGSLQGLEFHIEGTVEGKISAADSVTLTNQARVAGSLHTRALNLAAGARYSGQLVIGGEEQFLTLNLKSK